MGSVKFCKEPLSMWKVLTVFVRNILLFGSNTSLVLDAHTSGNILMVVDSCSVSCRTYSTLAMLPIEKEERRAILFGGQVNSSQVILVSAG